MALEQTRLYLMSVPFDTSNTLYNFSNYSEQFSTISVTYQKQAYAELSFVRINENTIRVQTSYNTLSNAGVNYLFYYDAGNSRKYGTYAFIEELRYISDNCTEIVFKVDVMQTYFFFLCTEKMGYIERCHSATDEIGDNIIPEGFSVGDLVCNDNALFAIDDFTNPEDWAVVVGVTDEKFESSLYCGYYDGFLSGVKLYAFGNSTTELDYLSAFLQKYEGKEDSVVYMYLCPWVFIPTMGEGNAIPEEIKDVVDYSYSLWNISKSTKLDGYTPDNAKMYTYPYNMFRVQSSDGKYCDLRYEFFENTTPRLLRTSNYTYPPAMTITPLDYGGIGSAGQLASNTHANLPYQISLTGFGDVGWRNSNFSSWLAQQSVALPLNLISSTIQGASVGGKAGAIAGVGSGLLQSAVEGITRYAFDSGSVNGSTSGPLAQSKTNGYGIYANRYSVPYNVARVIDDYFTRYGYKQDRYMEIPLKNRTNFTYVKCYDVDINPQCPKKYADEIRQILKNGITFWHNTKTFGDALNVPNNTL